MTIDTTDDLDFELPEHLIAQSPAAQRGHSRLLIVRAGVTEPIGIEQFGQAFRAQLPDNALIVRNNAHVMSARVPVQRPTGGRGELLFLAPDPDQSGAVDGGSVWSVMARPARKYRDGMRVETAAGGSITMLNRSGSQTWRVAIDAAVGSTPAWLDEHGQVPLPPYIAASDEQDLSRYQTVYAQVTGSVAAPTAGLHLSRELATELAAAHEMIDVTLHVGAGTFLPINDGALDDHDMHHEQFEIGSAADQAVCEAVAEGRPVVAIGTTSVRVLESVYGLDQAGQQAHGVRVARDAGGSIAGSTQLFIRPGYRWGCVHSMLTNFHLPKSTLIALVMAFHGVEPTRRAYKYAIEHDMRFYSFGDAMYIHGPSITN